MGSIYVFKSKSSRDSGKQTHTWQIFLVNPPILRNSNRWLYIFPQQNIFYGFSVKLAISSHSMPTILKIIRYGRDKLNVYWKWCFYGFQRMNTIKVLHQNHLVWHKLVFHLFCGKKPGEQHIFGLWIIELWIEKKCF